MPRKTPRNAPYFSIAWMVYAEQVGVKRQLGGNSGEIQYWYPRTRPTSTDLGSSETLITAFIHASPPAGQRLDNLPYPEGR